jgi:hypothetical protein
LIKTTQHLAVEGPENAQTLTLEMFQTAQLGIGSEAAAFVLMAARSAGGSPELAALVRERQDLAEVAPEATAQRIHLAAEACGAHIRAMPRHGGLQTLGARS